MRKRTINNLFDKILWGSLMLLPLVVMVIGVFSDNYLNVQETVINSDLTSTVIFGGYDIERFFSSFCSYYNGSDYYFEEFVNDSLLYNTFCSIFGVNPNTGELGVLAFFGDGFVPFYLTWIIGVNIAHIFVDVILLLPRICSKFLRKFGAEDD